MKRICYACFPGWGATVGGTSGRPGQTGRRARSTSLPRPQCSPRSRKGFAPGALFSSGVVPRRGMNNWSVIATSGRDPGQVSAPTALAVDAAGKLYVVDLSSGGVSQIEERDPQGNWSVVAVLLAPGASALAVDGAGRLYIADGAGIQTRD